MKQNKPTYLVFALLILASALYRVWDNRPLGFAPQIAMALFAGAVIRDRKFSFLVPLISMLISDAIYEVLFRNGLSDIKGFYSGQWLNYALFTSITFIGFAINNKKIASIFVGSLAGVAFFFIASNFAVWIGGGWDINNLPYPKTFSGLMTCYAEAVPFLKGSLYATLAFGAVFFGGYAFFTRKSLIKAKA